MSFATLRYAALRHAPQRAAARRSAPPRNELLFILIVRNNLVRQLFDCFITHMQRVK
jgi:hypothetical protein